MVSDLTIALAGGVIGSLATAGFTQLGRARAAWAEVELHDQEAAEYNAQLVVWVDDRTRSLLREMSSRTNAAAAQGLAASGGHGASVANAKEDALHDYRDREWNTRLDLLRLRTSEGLWHTAWRIVRRRRAPNLTVLNDVEPFLERWREPVTRHGGPDDAVSVFDRTRRTTADALAELPDLNLT